MKRINNSAFTLVEILVVCGVVSLFLAIAISVFSNFRQGYSKSESGAILLQDAALFLAQIRNDMNNAVIDPGSPSAQGVSQFSVEPQQLSFKIYDNRSGKIVPVVYSLVKKGQRTDLQRKSGSSAAKTLISDNVDSIHWQSDIETFSGPASGTIRLSLKLVTRLKTEKGKEKPFEITTRIFPARLNRQLNAGK